MKRLGLERRAGRARRRQRGVAVDLLHRGDGASWTSNWIGWSWPWIGTPGISIGAGLGLDAYVGAVLHSTFIAMMSSAVVSTSTRPDALTCTLSVPSTACAAVEIEGAARRADAAVDRRVGGAFVAPAHAPRRARGDSHDAPSCRGTLPPRHASTLCDVSRCRPKRNVHDADSRGGPTRFAAFAGVAVAALARARGRQPDRGLRLRPRARRRRRAPAPPSPTTSPRSTTTRPAWRSGTASTLSSARQGAVSNLHVDDCRVDARRCRSAWSLGLDPAGAARRAARRPAATSASGLYLLPTRRSRRSARARPTSRSIPGTTTGCSASSCCRRRRDGDATTSRSAPRSTSSPAWSGGIAGRARAPPARSRRGSTRRCRRWRALNAGVTWQPLAGLRLGAAFRQRFEVPFATARRRRGRRRAD